MSVVTTPETPPETGRPKVSVVMPVHNGEKFVQDAINSVLGQTFRDFEYIIVDDASTDSTPQILEAAAKRDARIRVIRLKTNAGIVGALNAGLDEVTGQYVARMDADDICLPERFEVQVAFLDQRPDVVLVGGSIEYIDAEGNLLRSTRRARDPWSVRWLLRFMPPIAHPTFMFRSRLADGAQLRYNPVFSCTEDYAFLCDAAFHGDIVSLPEIVLKYRMHGASISHTKYRQQLTQALEISTAYQKKALDPELQGDLSEFTRCYYGVGKETAIDLSDALTGLKRMLAADVVNEPARARWMYRQAGQLLTQAMRRSGFKGRQIIGALAGHLGRPLLIPTFMRFLETRRILPRALNSEPEVL